MPASKIHLVVIGGGYAGTIVSHFLDPHQKFRVTLIDPSDVKYHRIAASRAIADTSGTWVPRVLIPRNLKRGEFKQASVKSVDYANNTVALESGEVISYDYLVIATGSTTFWPTEPDGPSLTGRDAIIKAFQEVHAAIKQSKSIAIIGGGPSGTELAGELRYFNPDIAVTLYHSGKNLIADNFSPKFHKLLNKKLAEMGVTIATGERATVEGGTPLSHGGLVQSPIQGPVTVKTSQGTKTFDLLFNCIGIKPNAELVKRSFADKVDDRSQLRVNEFLQVEGLHNVFSCGDISSAADLKPGTVARLHAAYVIRNIVNLVGNKQTGFCRVRPSEKPTALIALGPKRGVMQLPLGSGVVMSSFAMRFFKSKNLYCDTAFKEVGLEMPQGSPHPIAIQ